ncbi:MAG: ABC transporter permease [Albidovulum sp.]|nr:ABC transporter permease [Albidovulum sp.]
MRSGLPVSITYIGRGDIAGIPVPFFISIAAAAFGARLLNRTRFGLYVKDIGGDREAARLAGVPVKRVEAMVYIFMGLFTALGGLIMMAQFNSTPPLLPTAMEIPVIAISAVIIGGTSLFGGRGTIYGTVMGALLLSMIKYALILAGVHFDWQLVVMGCIVLIAVAIGNLRERRRPMSANRSDLPPLEPTSRAPMKPKPEWRKWIVIGFLILAVIVIEEKREHDSWVAQRNTPVLSDRIGDFAGPAIGGILGGGVGAFFGSSIGIAAFGTAVAGTFPVLAVGVLAGSVVGYAGNKFYEIFIE